jgi:magnesium-protoporphyrin IX monomethyl ester (oxidative) cyclase
MKISIIELDARLYTMTSHLLMPKMGPLEVGTYLHTHGYDVSVYVECMNGVDEADILRSDVIGFSVGVGNANRVYEMVARLKATSSATFIAGGPHATMVPDEALDHGFDYVVRAEGEETSLDLVRTLEAGGDAGALLGVSCMRGGKPVHNAPRPFMKSFELIPSYSLLKGFRHKGLVDQLRAGKLYENFVQTTRGCPFPCDFCYENKIGGTGYRKRSIEAIVDDIRYKIDFLRTNVFYITDANFGLDAKFTKQLLRAMLDAKINGRFTALMRIEIARDPDLLSLLKAAGFEMLCIGIESLDDQTLDSVSKKQRRQQIEDSISTLRRHGLNVFGLFIGGFERDTEQTFVRIVDFALKHDMVGLNIMVLGEYPDHPDCIVPSHRYFNRNWDYFPGHYLTFFMPRMRPSQFQRVVSREALRFYSRSNCARSLIRSGWRGFSLKYGGRFVYRHVWKQAQTYLPYLESVEHGQYDGDTFVADERLRHEYAQSHPSAKVRVVSTVSPVMNFSAPVPGFSAR